MENMQIGRIIGGILLVIAVTINREAGLGWWGILTTMPGWIILLLSK